MAAVRASVRVSISWSGGAAYEDTDTLVLTINGWSVDLRVFTQPAAKEGSIDWATVSRVTLLPSSTPNQPVLQWDHLVDSRPPPPAHLPALPDQGRFVSLPSGLVEEHGTMYNSLTGQNEAYVETWRRLPCATGTPYCLLQREGGDGYIARVGEHVLGIERDEDLFRAYRDELREGQWERVFIQHAEQLPRLPVELPHWQAREVVQLDGERWIVHTAGTIVQDGAR